MLGPLFVDIEGTELTDEDREILRHPLVGGVIYFSRNYESPEQIQVLTNEIKSLRTPALLVGVDHEGGRVQRFRDGFSVLPAVGTIGELYDQSRDKGLNYAYHHGWLMAVELRSVGIDFSFAPVLDLNYGRSDIIGDRSFHSEAVVVSELAHYYIQGMNAAGMKATGKHFPGHGWAFEDSHVAIPRDDRDQSSITEKDVAPYRLLHHDYLATIMPAHVIYNKVDDQPAGFSKIWLQEMLRGELDYQGMIISDDLTMEGASIVAESVAERAGVALTAGCDMVLICNHREAVISTIDELNYSAPPEAQARIESMRGTGDIQFVDLSENSTWQQAREIIAKILA